MAGDQTTPSLADVGAVRERAGVFATESDTDGIGISGSDYGTQPVDSRQIGASYDIGYFDQGIYS